MFVQSMVRSISTASWGRKLLVLSRSVNRIRWTWSGRHCMIIGVNFIKTPCDWEALIMIFSWYPEFIGIIHGNIWETKGGIMHSFYSRSFKFFVRPGKAWQIRWGRWIQCGSTWDRKPQEWARQQWTNCWANQGHTLILSCLAKSHGVAAANCILPVIGPSKTYAPPGRKMARQPLEPLTLQGLMLWKPELGLWPVLQLRPLVRWGPTCSKPFWLFGPMNPRVCVQCVLLPTLFPPEIWFASGKISFGLSWHDM